MAENLQNLQRTVDQTWKQAFEGVEKTSQEFHDLVQEFTDFVGDWKEFSDLRRDRLADYLESLDSVQNHWEDINRWVSTNSDTLDTYAGSLSDIRNLFQDIASELGGLRRRTLDNVHVVRNLSSLATENLSALRQEGGLTDNIVKALSRKSTKIQEEYKARLQLLGVNREETNIPLILANEKERLDITNRRLNRLEAIRAQGIRLSSSEIDQLRRLRELQKLQESNIDLLDEHNRKASQGLDELIQKETKYYRAQRRGLRSNIREEDAGENAMPFRRVNIASKFMGKLGFAEESQELLRRYNRWATDRVEARQRTDLAERAAQEAQQNEITAQGDQKKALTRAGSYSQSSRKLVSQYQNQKSLVDEQIRAEQERQVELGRAYFEATDEATRSAIDAQQEETYQKINRLTELSKSLAKDIEREVNLQKQYNRELGTANIQLNLAKEAVKDTANELEAAKTNEKEVFGRSFAAQLKEIFSDINIEALLAKIGALLAVLVWRQLLKIDEEAVKTKRVIGQWADASALANTQFVSGTEVLRTMRELGEQFHINPVQVFTTTELGRITQAQKLTGMTSEAAGNLAVQSKIIGKNANTYRDEIAKGANQANKINHSAVSLSAVQNDVLTTSRAITLSYGANTKALAQAAGAAAAIGTNLQGVENIAKNLMQFESSIESEMQAQLLTGMQINLAKAREYALNNDLEGVAREVSRQGMDAAKFSHMNFIQQENMAKALGMSREEMSKMLIMQEINRGLTSEQVAAMTGMRREDIEALSAQEKWQTMKQRFLEALVPLLEPILQLTSDILIPVTKFVLGPVSWLAGLISRIGNLVKESNIVVRGLVGIVTLGLLTALFRGVGLVATFGKILGGVAKLGVRIGSSIAGWSVSLVRAGRNAQATGAVFDKTANRWRSTQTGRFVKAPAAAAGGTASINPRAAGGTSRLGRAFSSLGRNMNTILKGAVAMAIIAGALYIGAKACQEFAKVKWEDMGKAGVALVGLSITAVLVGKALSKAGPELLIGALYLAAFGVALIPVAFALRLAAPAFDAFANIVVAAGTAIKSALEGVATVLTATFTGLGTLLENISLEKAAALLTLGAGFGILGAGLIAGTAGVLLFPIARFERLMRSLSATRFERIEQDLSTLGNVSGLSQTADELTQIGVALGSVAENLNKVDIRKFRRLTVANTLGNLGNALVTKLAKSQKDALPKTDTTRESKENKRENIEEAVQSIVVKQVEANKSAQQVSIEQKATDLSKIEKKLDNVISAIKSAAPTDWNWLEFNRTQAANA